MKIKMIVVDMEADNIAATSNMINALGEILKTAFPEVRALDEDTPPSEDKT